MGLNGIDIASYQKTMNIAAVDADFVIVKVTQGVTYLNPYFPDQYKAAKNSGKLLGLYHYVDGSDAIAQADVFIQNVKNIGGLGQAILAVDFERQDNRAWGNAAYLKKLMDRIKEQTNVIPFVYIEKSACTTYANLFPTYPLWGASYKDYTPTYYQVEPWDSASNWGPWGVRPTIRQYQGKGGRVRGYDGPVDLNLFYGTKQDWKKYAAIIKTGESPKQQEQKSSTIINFNNYKNKIASSGKDENNRYSGGIAGDQTKSEWSIINWYNRPWNCVLRYPDKNIRELIAALSIEAANNDNIGYDQNQRSTYWQELVKANYRPSRVTTPCEADCSSGVIANVKAVGYLLNIPKLKNLNATYTGNMRNGFKEAGFEVLTDSKYLTTPNHLLPGDILLNDQHHVAVNLGVGIHSNSGVTNQPKEKQEEIGKNITTTPTKDIQTMLNKVGNYNLAVDNEYGPATTAAVKDFQKKNNLQVDGIVGQQTITELKKQYNQKTVVVIQPKKELTLNTTWNFNKQPIKNGKITAGLLNIRKGPGSSYGNLVSYPVLQKNTIVEVCDLVKGVDKKNWYYIKIKDKYGFASAEYVEIL